ncbi:Uncharacterized protein APZ42_032956 [Daphnia magna]|uniref:Uncharacterized protein n=2 Tax=Daphnia magna TaxID=35525 RepID=A0A164LI74_9CRUS|nr:Uncharacterized protein APZ42_032956 [Daphnia magna]
MVVYVPAASFTVEKTKPTTSTVNVTCKVEGVYPLPQLELIQEDGPHGNRMVVKETTLYISSRGGRYDATLHRVLEDKQLPSDAAFECLLSLPATEYQTAQKITYQPGAPLDGGIIPQAANDINEDHSHIGMGSGGGISIPSVSAPHRSLDAIASPAGDTTIEDDSENASVWQSGTGRGIRAHETTTDNGANVHKRPQILALLLAFFVMVSL